MDNGPSGFGEPGSAVMAQNNDFGNGRLIPQLFNSVPALNGAASYLAETTSYLTSCFPDFTGLSCTNTGTGTGTKTANLKFSVYGYGLGMLAVPRRSTPSLVRPKAVLMRIRPPAVPGQNTRTDDVRNEQEIRPLVAEQTTKSLSPSRVYVNRTYGSDSGLSASSNATTESLQSHDYIRRDAADVSSDNAGALVQSNSTSTSQSGISLFQGLVERARKTVRGSADDIGWLQRDPDMPPVEDGTERFMEILDSISHGVHRLPKSMIYLLVPGLFSNHGPLYFTSTKTSFSKMGLACHIAKIHSEASVENNARVLKEYIEEIYWGSKKPVMLLGHSKGGVDAAAALSMYWPELKDKVAGLVLAQSPYGGSPIASDILRPGQLGDYVNARKLMEILICKVIKGDLQALEDLTYERRREFLKKHPLPKELPVVSFHTEAKISPAVLATLSHVAHAELGQTAKLPVMIPLGAAMAACAQLLQVRYGEKSDGLVTCRDAEVPGSVVVRPKRKLDHAWMVYSSNEQPSEADASQVCEALLQLLMEGQRKMQEPRLKDE
ncbi:Elongation factor Tu [Bienertia sinuspersici]